MKSRVLFVIESLTAAGAERSLVSLLSVLDYSRLDIDLQLFRYGGALEHYLPPQVNLLPPLDYTVFSQLSFIEQLRTRNRGFLWHRILYSIGIRTGGKKHADMARTYWRITKDCFPFVRKDYHVAIAYSQGIPTYYVADKTTADKKICWVNYTMSNLSKKTLRFQLSYYSSFCSIVCVSDIAQKAFDKQFPSFVEKTLVLQDLIIAPLIRTLSKEKQDRIPNDKASILTVARFVPQKGFDITLAACKILKDRGVSFRWYALGQGPLKQEMELFIRKNEIQDCFFFLGTVANPYPYFKASTLYVQTSRSEGFGLSIAEARVLGVPVVTTEFDAVWQQMVQGKNGLVVPQDPVAVADAIERLLKDKSLYNAIVSYQGTETFDNSLSLNLFYRLLD